MFAWEVRYDFRTNTCGVHDPSGLLAFVVWEPMDMDFQHMAAFVSPARGGHSFYMDREGTSSRGGEAGTIGEYGWLLDLLREQTGLP